MNSIKSNMPLSKRIKILICLVFIFTLIGAGTAILLSSLLNTNAVRLQLLDNAGVMIESRGFRIYVDPVDLPPSFGFYPADAILITHPHSDHYQSAVIEMLQKATTTNIFPANMSAEISIHSGIGMVPGDQLQLGPINITAFYMYTLSQYGIVTSHLRESNWTSYIIDIDGFTIFHAGDSRNLEEYDELTDLIDVAILPFYTSIDGEEIVNAIQIIQPEYLILMHFSLGMKDAFITNYESEINDCEILNLNYFEAIIFSN